MTDFTSLLSSIGGQSKPQMQQSGAKPASQSLTSNRVQQPSNGIRSAPGGGVAGVKRKSEEPIPAGKPKVAKISSEVGVVRNRDSNTLGGPSTGASVPTAMSNTPYRGTARSSSLANTSKVPLKSTPKAVTKPSAPTATASGADSTAISKGAPKRGFASIMEKAKAAQEAAKATGSSGIRHKAVDRTTKRERQRQMEEAQQKVDRPNKPAVQSRDNPPSSSMGKAALKGKAQETSYKGTMKKAPAQLAYKGTMRNLPAGTERSKPAVKKGLGQDKYGGYASWSDLDDAEEDEEEEGFESDGSSDMEAGWGDTEREELHALRFAKQEDQQALEEEERLKRDKLERKRRLQELSKSNAGKRKY